MKKLFVILAMVLLFTSCMGGVGGEEQGATDSPEVLISSSEVENKSPDERFQTLTGFGYSTSEMLYTQGGDFSLCSFMDGFQDNETTIILKDSDSNQLLLFTYDPHGTYSAEDYQCTDKFYIEPGYFYFDIISSGTWVLSVIGNSWTAGELLGV